MDYVVMLSAMFTMIMCMYMCLRLLISICLWEVSAYITSVDGGICTSTSDSIDIVHLVELLSFSFAHVMPGKYNLKASHASWSFENVSTKCCNKT